MKKVIVILLSLAFGFTLAGCENMSKQDVGTVSGAAVGGLLGSQFGKGSGQVAAIAGGTLVGAFLGSSIGRSMDEVDRQKFVYALEHQAVGKPAYWSNDHTHANYTVVPTRNVTVQGNKYCREYRTTADIGGKKQNVYGTACRQSDGSWKIIK